MYYNLLSQLKNAVHAKKDKVVLPYSRMDAVIANILVETGYVKSADVEAVGNKKSLILRPSRSRRMSLTISKS